MLKFFLSNGVYFREKLRFFPFAAEFMSSRFLVVCTQDNDNIVGVCGIRSLFNIAVLYISENHRGQGTGSRLLKTAVEIAEKRPPYFVTATISSENAVIFHILCKLGFKEVLFLKRSRQILMVASSTLAGKLACAFFCAIGDILPNYLLSYIHLLLYTRTL